MGCSYGVMTEARRPGVAVDILAADGYNDLFGQLRARWTMPSPPVTPSISPIGLSTNNASIASTAPLASRYFELANDSTSDDLTTKGHHIVAFGGGGRNAMVIRDAQKRLQSVNIAFAAAAQPVPVGSRGSEGTNLSKTALIAVNIGYPVWRQ